MESMVDGIFFLLSTLNISGHYIWPQKFLMRNTLIILLKIPLYVKSCFSLAAFKILYFSLAFESLIPLSSSYLEFIEHLGCLYSSLSSNLGSFQPLSLQMFSLLLSLLFSSGTPTMCLLSFLMVAHRSLWLMFTSHYFFFLFIKLSIFHCLILKFIDFFHACANLPLNPSGEFFYFSYCTFSAPEFPLGFFLDLLSPYWYFHFVHSLFLLLSPNLPLINWTS